MIVTILLCLLACCAIMVAAWLWAHRIHNAGVVDVFWAFNFPVIAIIAYFSSPGWDPRKLAICGMFIVSGIRLGTHLAIRVIGHLDEEEGRYRQLRKEWAPNPDRKFFGFFQLQALSNVLLATPLFIASAHASQQFSPLEIAGIALWGIAFCGETIADRQLAAFKKDPAGKGKVCDAGLWNYSRHPNYFFEWLQWTAWFVFALGSPYGWLAAISPLSILYLLLKVTGIPATEEQSLRSKGELYKNYQRETSVFIPWFKKHP